MKFKLLFYSLLFSTMLQAQNYTYITDRRFLGPEDLIGYDFKPDFMEIPNDMEKQLRPGEYSFGISRSNLYVDGGDLKGVYSVNNINPTEYGYKLLLMNARDPTIQGHLKVILNKRAQVDALVFKRSNKEAEIIFFNAQMPDKLWNQELEYFTSKYDYEVTAPDSLWGEKFYPFMRIHLDEGGIQERLQMSDSTSIEFIEKITIVEKKKKKKKNKNDDEEEEIVAMENVEAEEIKADEGAMPPIEEEIVEEEPVAEPVEEVKETPTRRRRSMPKWNDSSDGAETPAETPVEEPVQKRKKEVKKTEPAATELAEENTEQQSDSQSESPIEDDDMETVKVKIIKEYFIKIRSILTYDDGTTEDKIWEYPVKKKFTEYETQSNGPNLEPYELELAAEKKGSDVSIFLTPKRTISAIMVDGKKYLMRGH